MALLISLMLVGCSDDDNSATDGPSPADMKPGGEGLVDSSVDLPPDGPPPKGVFSEVTAFGANPGNLRMFKYVPGAMPKSPAPLVVALHGCEMTADQHAKATGWNDLADVRRVYVVYPEQAAANNPSTCFNWFQTSDYAHGQGESQSIVQMVEQMKKDHAIDAQRIYVTGLSAGAAMAVDLGAVYPDLFVGVAAMAGIPYGCATDVTSGLSCMKGKDQTPEQWGDAARKARPGYSGPYPRMAVYHGDKDGMISYSILQEIMEQWVNLHGTDAQPEVDDAISGHTHRVYHDKSGQPVVETFLIKGMGHGIPVDLGNGPKQGGAVSLFSFNVKLWSSYYIAEFWGL
ncbi:MAG: alpha/beta hydrolase family esterase [Anaerolineae bacterium]